MHRLHCVTLHCVVQFYVVPCKTAHVDHIHANHYDFGIIFMLFSANYAIPIIIAILCFLLYIELLVL